LKLQFPLIKGARGMSMKINPYKYHYNKDLRKNANELRNHSTLAEIILWNEILKGRKSGYQFHRQRPILGYIGYFFCKELMLFIETDGLTHEDIKVKKKDKKKEDEITAIGYTILRFKDSDVLSDIEEVKITIESWIKDYEEKHPEVLEKKIRNKRS
jgi:very-short-patch-repair endonuclease